MTTVRPTGAATVWDRPERSARGPRPAHSRDEIAVAAIRIADAEGLDAVSMRRLAREVGAATTSLYRYVASKDELLELMADAAAGELGLAPLTGDWRDDLRALAQRERAQLKAHPWLLQLPGVRTMFGPNGLQVVEHGLGTVDGLGLDIDTMRVIVTTVITLTHGYVTGELADQQAAQRTGLANQEWMDAVAPYAQRILDSGDHPLVVRVIVEAEGPHAPDRADRDFALSLDLVLDGLEARLEAHP